MENKEIVNKYLSGLSLQIIADNAGCSRGTIKNILEKENIPLRKRTKRNDGFNNINALIEYREGNPVSYIAKKYGKSESTIRSYLQKHGEKLESFGSQKRVVKTNPFAPQHDDVMYWIGMIAADGTIEKAGKKTQPRIALFLKISTYLNNLNLF